MSRATKGVLRSALILILASAVVAVPWTLVITRDPFGRPPWEELVPIALGEMRHAAELLGVLLAVLAWVMRRRDVRRAPWLSRSPWLSATLLLIVTLLLFAPVSGFHHMFAFGILGYATVDCDSPPEDLPIPWGQCGIRGDAIPLALTIVAWLAFVAL